MNFDGGWCYANSLIAAAREVADKINQYGSINATEICYDYGIFIDQMTDAEREEFRGLVESYVH